MNFEDPDFELVHARVQAQHTHTADTAGELGVPAQRPTRTATTVAIPPHVYLGIYMHLPSAEEVMVALLSVSS